MWIIGPLVLYAVDAIYRSVSRHHRPAEIVGFKIHPEDVMEIRMRKESFMCNPGQVSYTVSYTFKMSDVSENPFYAIFYTVVFTFQLLIS